MGIKVLVVDDNPRNIRLLTDILEDENYEVYSVDHGLPVVEMTHTLKPDIILLDIMMPGLDGFEVCRQLKNNYEIKDIPIIMVTAKTDSIDVKNALDLGAFDYIKKPLDEVEVVARVQSALRFKEHQDRLKEMAMKDGLTGLYNHTLLMELFEKEVSQRSRDNSDTAFIMLDIDYFKKVNDTYGHMAGDMILKELSAILLDSVRTGDIVGRYGGEEFGIVLGNTDEKSAIEICERIRQRIEDNLFSTEDQTIHITISMGISIKKGGALASTSEVIKKADEALYKAKNDGRNRVVLL